jgi:hypothetical protein
MPFRMLFNRDMEVNLMSLQVFLTLQIPITGLTLASLVRGPSGAVMETHGSVVLPIALGQLMTSRLSRSIDLFQQFWSTQILVGYETPIRKIISLSFQRVQEHPDLMSYVTWISVLM